MALPANAQNDEYDLGVRPTGDDCLKAGVVETVVLQVLLENPEIYKGRCVTVEGYAHSRALFIRKADLKVKYPASSPKIEGRRLGLYGRDGIMEGLHQLPKGRYVRLTGKIWDCASMRTPDTLMLMGYCHYTGGPILNVVAFEGVQAPR